ncbi:MAG TPA: putative PEP-binding protein, partial [Amaricoccus sp.]|nr:putative PEP-binding protein [Amaricoccus sp.]
MPPRAAPPSPDRPARSRAPTGSAPAPTCRRPPAPRGRAAAASPAERPDVDAGCALRARSTARLSAARPAHSARSPRASNVAWAAASRAIGTRNGEHGGDPSSVRFCKVAGFDYVSCSPFRVPIARLAAAQATLLARGDRA